MKRRNFLGIIPATLVRTPNDPKLLCSDIISIQKPQIVTGIATVSKISGPSAKSEFDDTTSHSSVNGMRLFMPQPPRSVAFSVKNGVWKRIE
jgi:hypothetical protein